jgi:hypothetical protein
MQRNGTLAFPCAVTMQVRERDVRFRRHTQNTRFRDAVQRNGHPRGAYDKLYAEGEQALEAVDWEEEGTDEDLIEKK